MTPSNDVLFDLDSLYQAIEVEASHADTYNIHRSVQNDWSRDQAAWHLRCAKHWRELAETWLDLLRFDLCP